MRAYGIFVNGRQCGLPFACYEGEFMKNILGVISILGLAGAASAAGLGVADNYNLWALGNASSSFSDTQGRVAVGGNATFNGYDIGITQPGGDVLVAGGNISFTNGTIRGNARYGGTYSGTNVGYTNGGAPIAGNPINFGTANAHLLNTSSVWGSLVANGSDQQVFSSLVLSGSNANLNVFDISASQLLGISEVNINVTAGSTVLINVSGGAVTFNNIGYNLNGSQNPNGFRKVLWNAHQAGSISMSNLNGSLLAPLASANTGFGVINGQMIVGSFAGNMQINDYGFNGVVPEPGTIASLGLGALLLLRRRRS